MSRKSRQNRVAASPLFEILPPRTLLSAAPADLHIDTNPHAAGQSVYIWGSVANVTNLPANTPFTISLSPDNTPGNADDIPLGAADTNTNAGNTDILSLRLDTTLPSNLPPGNYHLVLTSPNTAPLLADPLTVITLSPTAELSFAPSYIMDTPQTGGAIAEGNQTTQSAPASHDAVLSHSDDNYDLFLNIANAGRQSANPEIDVYLSRDSIIGNADDILVSSTFDNYAPKGLAPALSTNYLTLRLNLPSNLPAGSYHPIVILDPNNLIPESDKSDNITVGPAFTVAQTTTDLSLTSVSATPVAGTVGSPVTVSATVFVNGSAVDRPDVFFYLQSLDNPDTYYTLGNYTLDQTLAAGSHNTPDLQFNIPINLPAGNYAVHASVGTSHRIAETDTNNNDANASSLITILNPDGSTPLAPLPSQTTAAPSSNTRNITRGSSARTSLTLTNPTTKGAHIKTTLHFYLSSDNKLSKKDRLFSSQTITPNLRPGHTSYNVRYTLPANTRLGTQYLIVVADTPASSSNYATRALVRKSARAQSITRLNVIAPRHLTASIHSQSGTLVTLRISNTSKSPIKTPVTLLLNSNDTFLDTIKRKISLKPGAYIDLTVHLPSPSPNLTVNLD